MHFYRLAEDSWPLSDSYLIPTAWSTGMFDTILAHQRCRVALEFA